MSAFSPYDGILLLNKPTGISSFKAIGPIRRLTGVQKVGHAGTLDPFASGLLIMAIGRRFTKDIDQYQGLPKTYLATFKLGQETPTLDPESEVSVDAPFHTAPSEEEITTTLASFLGEQLQTPPSFSAKKINGKKAYDLARKGQEVQLEPKKITIHSIELVTYVPGPYPEVTCRVTCSKGTYIRQLAKDVGLRLNATGYCTHLIREKIGAYSIENALNVADLSADSIKHHIVKTPPPVTA